MWSFLSYSLVAATLFSYGHAFVHHGTSFITKKQHHPLWISPVASSTSDFETRTATLYDILGADRTESRDQLKQRYNELARKCHPDAIRNAEQLLAATKKQTVLKRAKPLTIADKGTLMRMLKAYYTKKYYKMYVPGHENDIVSQESFLESRTDIAERRISLYQFSARVTRLKLMDEINEGTKPASIKLWNRVDREVTEMLMPVKDPRIVDIRGPDFAEIASAWSILSDSRERLKYDRKLAGQDITKKFDTFVGSFFRNAVPFAEAFGNFAFPLTTKTLVSTNVIVQKAKVHQLQYFKNSRFNMTLA